MAFIVICGHVGHCTAAATRMLNHHARNPQGPRAAAGDSIQPQDRVCLQLQASTQQLVHMQGYAPACRATQFPNEFWVAGQGVVLAAAQQAPLVAPGSFSDSTGGNCSGPTNVCSMSGSDKAVKGAQAAMTGSPILSHAPHRLPQPGYSLLVVHCKPHLTHWSGHCALQASATFTLCRSAPARKPCWLC